MRSPNAVTAALVGLFVVVQGSACSFSVDTNPGPDNQVFLDITSGPLRDRFSDAELLAEAKKVCDARAQGQTWDQLEQMVIEDLKLPPKSGLAGQFMGGVDGAMCPP
jgi:hypothetical protein